MTILAVSAVSAAVGCTANDPAASDGRGASTASTSVDLAVRGDQVRPVAPRFGASPQVLPDRDSSGIEASALFFQKSETAIITGPSVADQLRGASIAVVAHSPVLRFTGNNAEAIDEELARLGARTVLLVGDAHRPSNTALAVVVDNGSQGALGQLTAQKFSTVTVGSLNKVVEATANLDPKQPTLLVPVFDTQQARPAYGQDNIRPRRSRATASQSTAGAVPMPKGVDGRVSFPAQSAMDGGVAPIVVCSPRSSIPAVATAKAYGAQVRFMDYHDPRFSPHTADQVAGLATSPLVALGAQFGTGKDFSRLIDMTEKITQPAIRNSKLVFPAVRMVAYYGNPSGGTLGLLGETSPEEAVERLNKQVAQYAPLSDVPVVPAFEIIATVASNDRQADGSYSAMMSPESLVPAIDAISRAGGYAVIDLQPGRSSLVDQARAYESLLLRPNVGLALDPEWKLGPHEVPLQQVGHVDAAEINDVSAWLSQLVDEHNLPQKAMIVHQFQLQMVRDRENINLNHPELAWVLHIDGHGPPEDKLKTWEVMRQQLNPAWFMGWKNFIDEDTPTFTPEQTFDLHPKPWFVSYQ